MQFTYSGANLSQIIKTFNRVGNNFHVEYLDGSCNNYYYGNPEHKNELRQKMLWQAIERQEKISSNNDWQSLYLLLEEIILGLGLMVSIKSESDVLSFIWTLLLMINIFRSNNSFKVKKELEKYALFIQIYSSLDIVNKSEFMKAIEFDNFYQKRLDIETVDDFPLGT